MASLVRAQELTETNKSQFTLFNPTPADLMRRWQTDRAGQSPYTIDAGHFEVGLTAFDHGYFHRSYELFGRTSQEYSVAETEITVGLLNNVDIGASIVPYTIYTDKLRGDVNEDFKRSGVSDLESRIKWNLWGNDGSPTAMSIAGVVDFPTGTGSVYEEQFEGGVSLAFQAHVPYGFELRLHSAVLSFVDDFDNVLRRELFFENEISLSHRLVGHLWGYCLFNTYTFTTPDRPWDGTIGVGLTYRIRKNVELYAAMDFGVQGTPYDFSSSIGISARF